MSRLASLAVLLLVTVPQGKGEGSGDGYVDIVAADCGCVYECVVYAEEDQFECLCPSNTQLGPDLSDCYYTEEKSVTVANERTVDGNEIIYRGVSFGNSTFILSANVNLTTAGSQEFASEEDRCVLMFFGNDYSIVLATNPVIGSGTATTLSEVSLNLTSGALTMTDYTSFLNSSVLVTGAMLASTGDCEIGDTAAFNISVKETTAEPANSSFLLPPNNSVVSQLLQLPMETVTTGDPTLTDDPTDGSTDDHTPRDDLTDDSTPTEDDPALTDDSKDDSTPTDESTDDHTPTDESTDDSTPIGDPTENPTLTNDPTDDPIFIDGSTDDHTPTDDSTDDSTPTDESTDDSTPTDGSTDDPIDDPIFIDGSTDDSTPTDESIYDPTLTDDSADSRDEPTLIDIPILADESTVVPTDNPTLTDDPTDDPAPTDDSIDYPTFTDDPIFAGRPAPTDDSIDDPTLIDDPILVDESTDDPTDNPTITYDPTDDHAPTDDSRDDPALTDDPILAEDSTDGPTLTDDSAPTTMTTTPVQFPPRPPFVSPPGISQNPAVPRPFPINNPADDPTENPTDEPTDDPIDDPTDDPTLSTENPTSEQTALIPILLSVSVVIISLAVLSVTCILIVVVVAVRFRQARKKVVSPTHSSSGPNSMRWNATYGAPQLNNTRPNVSYGANNAEPNSMRWNATYGAPELNNMRPNVSYGAAPLDGPYHLYESIPGVASDIPGEESTVEVSIQPSTHGSESRQIEHHVEHSM